MSSLLAGNYSLALLHNDSLLRNISLGPPLLFSVAGGAPYVPACTLTCPGNITAGDDLRLTVRGGVADDGWLRA